MSQVNLENIKMHEDSNWTSLVVSIRTRSLAGVLVFQVRSYLTTKDFVYLLTNHSHYLRISQNQECLIVGQWFTIVFLSHNINFYITVIFHIWKTPMCINCSVLGRERRQKTEDSLNFSSEKEKVEYYNNVNVGL